MWTIELFPFDHEAHEGKSRTKGEPQSSRLACILLPLLCASRPSWFAAFGRRQITAWIEEDGIAAASLG
jgi:hypothetical protein